MTRDASSTPERGAAFDRLREGSRCPLCRSEGGKPLVRLSYEQIWRRLQEEWGARFSAGVKTRHTPVPDVTLYGCASCGLEYFFPAVSGDSEFYTELMHWISYEHDRWEFGVVSDLVDEGESVADFGCGNGAFLTRLGQRRGRVVGVDYNREAIDALAGMGLEAYAGDFAEFAVKEQGAFDTTCAFQLIEHLSDVESLIGPMVKCTRPGGRLFISLPNRDRYGADPTAPLDCPPHHASRWSVFQLGALARRHSLTLVKVRCSPLTYAEATQLCLAPLDRLMPLGEPRLGAKKVLRGLIRRAIIGRRRHSLAVRAGLFARRGVYGHTMLAEFRTPGG